MTGLELLGLGVGFAALHESNEKNHWSDSVLNTLEKPAKDWSVKQLLLVLGLISLLTFIWFNVLRGYIWE